MRIIATLALCLSSFMTAPAVAQPPGGSKPARAPPRALIPRPRSCWRRLMRSTRIRLPVCRSRRTSNTPHTVKELEPFHHVEPFKTHFRTQLEYTGPGRTIPEPSDLKSVKVGFIGPLYPTVSVATGGKSHEEVLGKKMYQGACLPSRRRMRGAAISSGSCRSSWTFPTTMGSGAPRATRSSSRLTRTRSGRSWAPSMVPTATSQSASR